MRILLLSNFYPPANTVASHRLYSFAKYLPEFGIHIDIFTPRRQGNLHYDISNQNILYSHFDISIINKFAGKSNKLKEILKHLGVRPLKSYCFSQFYKAGKKKLPSKIIAVYDAILASYGPESVLRLGYFLRKKHNIPLILDFRDLWLDKCTFKWTPMDRMIIKRIEKKIIKEASLIISTSKGFAELLEKRYKVSPKVIYNGYFDQKEIMIINSNETNSFTIDEKLTNICYCGSLYGGLLPVEIIFPILRQISDFHLHIAVLSDIDYTFVKDLIDKYHVNKQVTLYKNLPNHLSIDLQSKCNVLLMLNVTTDISTGVLPAKLFEYMQAKKFILGIGYSEDEAGSIIRNLGIGAYVNKKADIIAAIKNAKSHNLKKNPDISFFSRKNQAKILAKELKQFLPKHQN